MDSPDCSRLAGESGITMMEVLISMILLALGTLGLAPVMILSIDSNTISRDFDEASRLAERQIEFYQSQDSLGVLPIQLDEANVNGRYNRRTSIVDNATDTTLPAGLQKIDVLIEWTDDRGVIRSTSHATLLDKD